MNYTTAVFLINPNVRAIMGAYEDGLSAPKTMFKTLDPEIRVGDFVVVPTDTRHKMTVVKVTDVDVDLDIDSVVPVHWIIEKIDRADFEQTLAGEATAVQQIKSAEMLKKRKDLAAALIADSMDSIKALPIAMAGSPPALK